MHLPRRVFFAYEALLLKSKHRNMSYSSPKDRFSKRSREMEEPKKNPASYKRQKNDAVTDDEETQSDSSDQPETLPPLPGSPVANSSSNVSKVGSGITPAAARKNAFTELMAKKSKPPPPSIVPKASQPSTSYYLDRDPRSGLATYLVDPAAHSSSSVIFYNEDFVVINDAFPKAMVHALVLPRDIKVTHLQPLLALNSDPALLASLRKVCVEVRTLLAKELQRLHAKTSATELARQKAFEALEDWAMAEPGFDPDSEEALATLPPHRDWESCIKIGVHARPSMSNLHVHIISQDMHSPSLKKRQHYNSFNTKFFVNLDEFPLNEDDFRIPGEGRTTKGLLESDYICWRCGRDFGNKFKQLKEHLDIEYTTWKKI